VKKKNRSILKCSLFLFPHPLPLPTITENGKVVRHPMPIRFEIHPKNPEKRLSQNKIITFKK
jgi:hypothetical protein